MEGHRQLTRRIHLARENICHAETTLLTTLPGADESIYLILPRSHVDRTADVEQYHHLLAFGMIGLAHGLDQHFLILLQVEVALRTISSLTTLTTNRDDGHIATLAGGIQFVGRKQLFFCTCWGHQREGRTAIGEEALFLVGKVFGIEGDEGLIDLIACTTHTLDERYGIVAHTGATKA